MAFELTGFEYDATRQQNKLIRHSKSSLETDGVNRGYQYNPAPYNLNFTLSVLAKNMSDALQIVEQILPYFQPEYTVTMKMIDDMSDVRDVPITLNSVGLEDTYEGSFEERRVIEYTLEFTMKIYFFALFILEQLSKTLSKESISILISQVNSQLHKLMRVDWSKKLNIMNLLLQKLVLLQ